MPTIDEAINIERERRLNLRKHGRPYIYWQVRGDDHAPPENHWCAYCAGYFGVPHDFSHPLGRLCRNIGRAMRGERQCACIDCIVAEAQPKVSVGG